MSKSISEIEIKTLKDFSSLIEDEVPLSENSTLWFRGCGDSDFELSPSIHRHPIIKDPKEIIDLEKDIIERFNQRSIPFLNNTYLNRTNDWEVLFFMQHYGISTRLLDWTENPYMALFFALTTAKFQVDISGKKNYFKKAAVWMLDPVLWNRESLKHLTFNGGIISVDDHAAEAFKPKQQFEHLNKNPIAIYGTHNSSRIVAQRGVFTVFGKETKSLEKIFLDEPYPESCLKRIILPEDSLGTLFNSLYSIGITDSVVYPDLEGFSTEIKRFFKFI